jgi:uncharacterized membrane protein YeaQ/YmgE (transglycosylase-associated protein family)
VFAGAGRSKEEEMLAPESILGWIVVGAIAGWLAGVLVKGYGFGLIGNIVVGILGAGIGGLWRRGLGCTRSPLAAISSRLCWARWSSCCLSA